MNSEVMFGFIFAIIYFIFTFYVWYQVCFVDGALEKWRDDVISAHKKSKSMLKENSILFHPLLLKAVSTIMMLSGILAIGLALRDIIVGSLK